MRIPTFCEKETANIGRIMFYEKSIKFANRQKLLKTVISSITIT